MYEIHTDESWSVAMPDEALQELRAARITSKVMATRQRDRRMMIPNTTARTAVTARSVTAVRTLPT